MIDSRASETPSAEPKPAAATTAQAATKSARHSNRLASPSYSPTALPRAPV